jgi:hypothetical protein
MSPEVHDVGTTGKVSLTEGNSVNARISALLNQSSPPCI